MDERLVYLRLKYSGLANILGQEDIWYIFIKCSGFVEKHRANISNLLNYKMSLKTQRPLWSLLASIENIASEILQ